jgi:HAD superfamily hydrolase (TIGR01549 family)
MARRPRSLLFDFGGTLFSYRTVYRSISDAILEAGARLAPDAPRRNIGKAYGAATATVWDRRSHDSYYRHRDVMIETYREFAVELGREADDDFIEWMYVSLRDATVNGFELREDCIETLEALRERGLGVAIVSNIDDDYLHPMVERCGIAPYLDRWTSSEEAGSCKPDPGFFLHCADLADCPPAETLYVGDSPFHDVKGARGVGMSTALIVDSDLVAPGQGDSDVPEPDHTIKMLRELLAIVDG